MDYSTIMKYKQEIFNSELEWKTYRELEDDLEETLNECCEPFKIGTLIYDAGRVLREIDPIAFDQDVNADSAYTEICLKVKNETECRYYNTEEIEEFINNLESIEQTKE